MVFLSVHVYQQVYVHFFFFFCVDGNFVFFNRTCRPSWRAFAIFLFCLVSCLSSSRVFPGVLLPKRTHGYIQRCVEFFFYLHVLMCVSFFLFALFCFRFAWLFLRSAASFLCFVRGKKTGQNCRGRGWWWFSAHDSAAVPLPSRNLP